MEGSLYASTLGSNGGRLWLPVSTVWMGLSISTQTLSICRLPERAFLFATVHEVFYYIRINTSKPKS
ncbi:hypothetical protein KIN20_010526 [Parelaphostrongylus tenuis]|uniref:Uncharacterized protein n=1 Tax=Parelaphostrongylus tenuis TaxID=148309 RepID=A0AAD5QP69_PARTN|nr:hypothetical protein KIN20_010519 [Parelaphostrongylus tenuis]KAJ1353786.1 hypothetical protein KIN20_010526 [Parelaphostrongylus tenuis]